MAGKRFKDGDLIGLTPQQAAFVIEYIKDFQHRRAALASGHNVESGSKLLNQPVIAAAIQHILIQQLDSAQITAEWVLMEAVDNHVISRQNNNMSGSNAALNLIAKHTMVDAIASDKLNMNVHGDKEIMERLTRGRKRQQERGKAEDDEVSFF